MSAPTDIPHRGQEDGASSSFTPSSFNRERSTARLGSSPSRVSASLRLRAESPTRNSISSRHSQQYGGSPMPQHGFEGNDTARSSSEWQSNEAEPLLDFDDRAGTPTSNMNIGDLLSEDEVARIVRRHLALPSSSESTIQDSSGYSRSLPHYGSIRDHSPLDTVFGSVGRQSFTPPPPSTTIHHLTGASVTDEIYKWADKYDSQQYSRRTRSQSFHDVSQRDPLDPSLQALKSPGGFRRHYVTTQAQAAGREPPNILTRNFLDFLVLYGHFGGMDLNDIDAEDDDDAIDEIMESRVFYQAEDGSGQLKLKRSGTGLGQEVIARVPPSTAQIQGTATPMKAVFLLLKAFIGTGVMFLPKAFYNGGLLFSTFVMLLIAGVSLFAFLLLVNVRAHIPASFGDMGGILFGPRMRLAVLAAIAISQMGFVCAYMVFVAENVQSLLLSLTNCRLSLPIAYCILGQLFVFVPLAMVRKISKLSFFALIADAFILVGLVYLYTVDIGTIVHQGVGDVAMFNVNDFALAIGTAVFTFEGVGLIIPITESMKDPRKFPAVLTYSMLFVTFVFTTVGICSYMAFGSSVQTVILLNLPAGDRMVDTVQGLYALAICLSIPLQLFPAIRIIETALFTTRSGKFNQRVKWEKNAVRLFIVVICAVVSIGGANDLDKFVSLIGALACIPLGFILPGLFHLKGVAKTPTAKFADMALIIFGLLCMIFSAWITAKQWASAGDGGDQGETLKRCIPDGGL